MFVKVIAQRSSFRAVACAEMNLRIAVVDPAPRDTVTLISAAALNVASTSSTSSVGDRVLAVSTLVSVFALGINPSSCCCAGFGGKVGLETDTVVRSVERTLSWMKHSLHRLAAHQTQRRDGQIASAEEHPQDGGVPPSATR